jgi:hypothetical protein
MFKKMLRKTFCTKCRVRCFTVITFVLVAFATVALLGFTLYETEENYSELFKNSKELVEKYIQCILESTECDGKLNESAEVVSFCSNLIDSLENKKICEESISKDGILLVCYNPLEEASVVRYTCRQW